MEIKVRQATSGDIEACGVVCYRAFSKINQEHGFLNDIPSEEFGIKYAQYCIGHPYYYCVLAQAEDKIIGACYLEERSPIRGVGMVAVEPEFQGRRVGYRMLEAILERSRDAAGVRLLQHPYNTCSMSLYAKVGFEVKEPIAWVQGEPGDTPPKDYTIRPMEEGDIEACRALSMMVYGFDRTAELPEVIAYFKPFVAIRHGRIVAYTSAVDVWWQNYAIAREEEDLKALVLGIGQQYEGPLNFLLPNRQANLFYWFLQNKFRMVKPLTLMTVGEYKDPNGYYFTSINY